MSGEGTAAIQCECGWCVALHMSKENPPGIWQVFDPENVPDLDFKEILLHMASEMARKGPTRPSPVPTAGARIGRSVSAPGSHLSFTQSPPEGNNERRR